MASSSTGKLEPFLLMAKSAKGVSVSKLIENATAAPGVYVYAELLDVPNVKEVHATYRNTIDSVIDH
jgi:COP9 signalosome complex subunit 7